MRLMQTVGFAIDSLADALANETFAATVRSIDASVDDAADVTVWSIL